jgi:poly(ADP-ribose) glycohydrolase ARH3
MTRMNLVDKYWGALLGVAVGDALGAPFEGRPPVSLVELQALRRTPHELRYTDDTHMTIGLAQSLVQRRGFDGPHMARRFAENYFKEPWRGYGAGPPRVFQQIVDGSAWDEPAQKLFDGSGSFGNGAAMRVAPVALYAYGNLRQVAELARQTARITHAHELGVEGAVLQACAVALLLASDPGQPLSRTEFLTALRENIHSAPYEATLNRLEGIFPDPDPETVVREIGNDITALAAVPAALCCFLRHPDSFSDAVLFAIALGGDTDTIASMTGALCGACLGESAIPDTWILSVEGRGPLRRLGRSLHNQRLLRQSEA